MNRDRSGSIAVIPQQVVYINLKQTFLLLFMFMLQNTFLLPYLTTCPFVDARSVAHIFESASLLAWTKWPYGGKRTETVVDRITQYRHLYRKRRYNPNKHKQYKLSSCKVGGYNVHVHLPLLSAIRKCSYTLGRNKDGFAIMYSLKRVTFNQLPLFFYKGRVIYKFFTVDHLRLFLSRKLGIPVTDKTEHLSIAPLKRKLASL